MLKLTEPEIDLCEFISDIRGLPIDIIENLYNKTKEKFNFRSDSYRTLFLDTLPLLYAPICSQDTDEGLITGCKILSLLYLYRTVSYEAKRINNNQVLYEQLSTGQEELMGWSDYYKKGLDGMILLDYGTGTASRTLGFCKKYNMKACLVDIDALMLDFVCFRFKKNNIDYVKIPVTKNNIYPKFSISTIDLAIMFDSIEHLKQPIEALKNIKEALKPEACLKINNINNNQKVEWQHPSYNMQEAKNWLNNNMIKVSDCVWKKCII